MTRHLKHSTIFFVLSISVQPVLAQKTLWTSEDLERIEVGTIIELLHTVSGWTNSTNDDVTIQFSRNGLAGLGGAWWPFYINGTQIHLQTWNTQSLYSLPLNLSQLDSVVIIESPMIYEGTFTEKGGIFIYSKKLPEGFSVEGNMSFGNRSGDPGPFIYTEYASPNIERIGPLIDTQVSFKNKIFGARAGLNAFFHSVTDGILQYRRIVPFEFGEQRPT